MFAIDEDNSIGYYTEFIPSAGEGFASLDELTNIADVRKWSKQTVTDIWNGFAGTAGPFRDLKPMKCFKNRPYGLAKIWDAIRRLVPSECHTETWLKEQIDNAIFSPAEARSAASEPAAPANDTVEDMPKKKVKAKKAPKTKRVGFIPETKPGSNLDQLIKMIGRKQGASIEEVMARTGWTATHSVRGRISVLKSKGMPIESFKHETRGRVYRCNQ